MRKWGILLGLLVAVACFCAAGGYKLAVPLFLKEDTAASDDIAGYGQVWVKNDTPNTLWYTDDGGTDYQLGIPAVPWDSTDYDTLTWGDGTEASFAWAFDVSGADTTLTFGDGSVAMVGSFSVQGSGNDTASTGSDLITNGTFDSDLTGWTAGAGWAWEATGKVEKTAGTASTLTQSFSVTDGVVYCLTFDMVRTAGTVTITIDLADETYTLHSTYDVRQGFKATSTGTATLTFSADEDWAATLDNIALVPLTGTTDAIASFLNADSGISSEIRGNLDQQNTFYGLNSGQDATGIHQYSCGFGYGVLQDAASGQGNVGMGWNALSASYGGSFNVAVGYEALQYNTCANSCTAIGSQALQNNISGRDNTAVGAGVLRLLTTGEDNVAVGQESSRSLTTGEFNTAVGTSSLVQAVDDSYNTAVGWYAGYNCTGDDNVFLGRTAGIGVGLGGASYYGIYIGGKCAPDVLDDANYNTIIGYQTGEGIVNGDNNTIIGSRIDLGSDVSGYVVLGDGTGDQRMIIDNNGEVEFPDGSVTCEGVFINETAWSTTSSKSAVLGYLTKTAGISDASDHYGGGRFSLNLNQSGGVIGSLYGVQGTATMTAGTATNVYALNAIADLNAGTVNTNVYGALANVDIEAGMTLSGDVFGANITMDVDTDPSGTVYGLRMAMGSNQDWGIYQSGAAKNLFSGGLFMPENAAADTPIASYGEIWVKTGAPNTLWFTDENDVDYQLGVSTVASTTDTTCWVGLWETQTGAQQAKSDGGLTYNATTNTLTSGQFYQNNTGLTIDDGADYNGILNQHVKTAGTMTDSYDLWACRNFATMNQSGGVCGSMGGVEGYTTLTDGTPNRMYGGYTVIDIDGGAVAANVYGLYNKVDIEAACSSIGESVYGYLLDMDVDCDPVGSVYGIHMTLGSNQDWAIYCAGAAAPSRFGGASFMPEQAAANTDIASYGQVWVKTGSPNTLWFTDEDGTDFQLGVPAGPWAATNYDDLTWSGGTEATLTWTFDVSGTDTTLTWGDGSLIASGSFKAADFYAGTGNQGGTNTTGGLVFEDGLYISGDAASGEGVGDITAVGDCLSGDALDGTSDGGTWIKFYDADGAGQLITGDLTDVRTWTLPDATGTVAVSGWTFAGDVAGTLTNSATTLTIQADSVALTTDTTGDYTAGISAGNYIDVTNGSGEGVTATIDVDPTEMATITWGAASTLAWTFDAGAIDPTLTFTSALITLDDSVLLCKTNSGSTSIAWFATNDFVGTTTGSALLVGSGAASGDTYMTLQAYDAGASSTNDLYLQPAGGNVAIPGDSRTLRFGAVATDYTIQWDGSDAVHTVTAGDFVFTGGTLLVGGTATIDDFPTIEMVKTITETSASSHGITDSNTINSGRSYASFSTEANIANNAGLDYSAMHLAMFQANARYSDAGNIGAIYGYTNTFTNNGGNVDAYHGAKVQNPGGTGTYTSKYGYACAVISGATTNNWQFFAEGTTGQSYFGGSVGINASDAALPGRVTIDCSASAAQKLLVGRNYADAEVIQLWSDATGDGALYLYDSAGNADVIIDTDGANTFEYGINIDQDSQPLRLGEDATDYTIQWDGSDAVHTVTAGDFVFTGGNVGINQAAPAYLLEVNGTFQADDYYAGDGTQGAGATTGGLTFIDGLYTSGTIAVTLGTETSGDYVYRVTAGNYIDIDNESGEGVTAAIDVDPTEMATITWGAASTIAWTFNAGAVDPVITFDSGSTTLDDSTLLTLTASGSTTLATFANNDWAPGSSSGTAFQVTTGAATSNTYVKLQTLTVGGNSQGVLAINPAGGNVAVGATSASYLLDVAGTLQANDYYSGAGTQGASATTGGLTFEDGLYVSGSATTYGDITAVGDCTSGDALDGTSDGGTWIKFYDAQGAGQLINGNLTAVRTWTTPDASGTLLVSGHTLTGDVTATFDTDGSTATTLANDSVDQAHVNWADIDYLGEEGAITVADTTDTTCFVGLWESATGDQQAKSDAAITYNAATGRLTVGDLYASDATLDTTTDYQAVMASVVKTAGLTDASDNLSGVRAFSTLNQAGGTIGTLYGVQGTATITAGTVGSGTETSAGGMFELQSDGGAINGLAIGVRTDVDLNAGSVTGNVYGTINVVDLESALASIGGSVYGYYLSMDCDEDPAGSAYGIYLSLASNCDWGYYQSGAAPSLFGGAIYMPEQAAASADIASYAQMWVKTGTPNTLWFTNESGTDSAVLVSGHTLTGDVTATLDSDGSTATAFANDSVDQAHVNWADIDYLGEEGALTVIDSTDASSYFAVFDSATGDMQAKTDAGAAYNSTTGQATFTIVKAGDYYSGDGTQGATDADVTGLSFKDGLYVSGDVTPAAAWSATDYDDLTWDAGTVASITWMWNLTGTDPTFVFGDGLITAGPAFAVDNLYFDGNTISSSNENGDIYIDPNGLGGISMMGGDPQGSESLAWGDGSVSSGTNSVTMGEQSTASAADSFAMGSQAVSNIAGQHSQASGTYGGGNAGDAQSSVIVLRAESTNTSGDILASDGGGLNTLAIPADTVWAYELTVVATEELTANDDSAHYTAIGRIENNNGTTTVQGGAVTTVHEDDASWDLTVAATDGATDYLTITFFGDATNPCRIVGRLELTQVTY